MYVYLLCIILGILIYILWNRYNGFSVGIPQYIITVSPDGSDINIRPSRYSDNPRTWEVNDDGVLSSDNTVIIRDEHSYYVYGDDITEDPEIAARRNFDEYIREMQSTAGGTAGGTPSDTKGGISVSAVCSSLVSQQTYFEIADVIQKNILSWYQKRMDQDYSYEENKEPFTKAIVYTLENSDVPLFYSSSRFWYTIIHLLKNGTIYDITLNEPRSDVNIQSSTSLFGNWGGGNSSTDTGILSVSTCLCDLDPYESATDYYFFRKHQVKETEWTDRNAYEIRSFIKSHIPDSTASEERIRLEGIINNISGWNLISRVLFVFKPISRVDSEIDTLLENNVRQTWAFGWFPSKIARRKIIGLNQDMTNIKETDSTQARLLYRNTQWEVSVFLSEEQQQILKMLIPDFTYVYPSN